MTRGVVYVATGREYIEAAAMSIGTLRRFFNGPVMILTNKPADYLARFAKYYRVDVVVHDTGDSHQGRSSRVLKTQVATLCPYDVGIFLDADTLVVRDIEKMWTAPTDDAPIAMTLGCSYQRVGQLCVSDMTKYPSLQWDKECRYMAAVAGPSTPYYSSSTIVWKRTPKLLELFQTWHEEWKRIRVSDMPSMVRALARTGTKVVKLPRRFNSRHKFRADVVIYTARMDRIPKDYTKRYFRGIRGLVTELMRG
jgi:hypothetical protein